MFKHIAATAPKPVEPKDANHADKKPALPRAIWSAATIEAIKADITRALSSETAQERHVRNYKRSQGVTVEVPQFNVEDEQGNLYDFGGMFGDGSVISYKITFTRAEYRPKVQAAQASA